MSERASDPSSRTTPPTLADRPIVVGVDGSPAAQRAADWAATEAARRHHRMRLVFADDSVGFGAIGGLAPPQSFFDAMQAAGERVLTEARAAIGRAHPELTVDVELCVGGPVPALLDSSAGALLVVVGARGGGGFRGMLAGSTAVALVAHGRCPVAVVRGGDPAAAPPTTGPVVVGVDGSATSDAAVAAAFDEATWRGAELVAVHSRPEYPMDPSETGHHLDDWDAAEQGEHELLAERLAGWQEKYPDVRVRRVLAKGQAVEALLDNAVGAQLLVVGSRGRGGFTGMALGSTSQALIHHATCPLLVVRPAVA